MAGLQELLEAHVGQGEVTGAVAVIAGDVHTEVAATGSMDLDGGAPMTRDTVFRIASITKPITAAAALVLIDDGRIGLDDPVATWLPEIASPQVVRTPASPVDDTAAAEGPVTIRHLLASRSGWGFPDDFSLPAVQPLITELGQGPTVLDLLPDEWMATLARIPLLHQPGQGWLYNTSYDILGVLIARVAGTSLQQFMAERLFQPLGMTTTGFTLPAQALARIPGYYRHSEAGPLEEAGAPGGHGGTTSAFESGAGGLLCTADDWLAFGRMLLSGGTAPNGGRVLSRESIRLMTTNQLSADERAGAAVFLEGQGWGYGGSVDVDTREDWTVPGRYGWVGGTGTSAHVCPATGTISILMTQTEMTGPSAPPVMLDFWRYGAGRTRTVSSD